ncbi:hypothetical protein HYW19_01130, partial [Candidatus Woesearchaeota archaeon]|nr:hypothetical protein [Candidatus Woesearchaeota archaeon]
MNHNLILIFNLSALLFVFFAFAAYAGDVSIETGNILTEKDNELFLSLKNTEAEGHEYRLVSGGYLGNIGVGNFAVYDATAESARLTIDTNGKVIIGTRDTPGSLDLWGGQIVTSGLSLIKYVNRIPVSFSRIIQVGSDSSNAEMRIIQSNRITMTLKSDGNVGIGTTRPTSKLSITGATTGGLTLLDLNSTDDTDSAISFKTEDYKWNIGRTDGGNFFFWDGSGTAGTRMVIQNGTGRVGIGTTLPAGKLDVYSGALFISGARTYTPLNVPSIHTDSTDTALFVPTSTGGNLDLRLYIDDDASDMFSIWGNSCRTGGTGGGCQNLAKSLEIARFVGGGTVALGLNG